MAGGIGGIVLTEEGHTLGRRRQAVVHSDLGAVLTVHGLTPPTGSPARRPATRKEALCSRCDVNIVFGSREFCFSVL